MKTLDEVIKAYEYCIDDSIRDCRGCPYGCEDGDAACFNHDKEDAIHYLKEYQKKQDETFRQAYIAVRNEILFGSEDINPALTWEQLKQMEGRPVWIETDENLKFWTIVDNFRTICNQECLCCAKGGVEVYRKERNENAR